MPEASSMVPPHAPLSTVEQFENQSLAKKLKTLRPFAEERLLRYGWEAPSPFEIMELFGIQDADALSDWSANCVVYDAYYLVGVLIGQMIPGVRGPKEAA